MIPLMLLVGFARATNYTVDICGQIGVDFIDADSGNGDDYVTSSGPMKARGAHIQVLKYGPAPLHIYDSVIADYWASTSGSYPGCIPISLVLDSTQSYKMRIYSEATVNGQAIQVFDDPATYDLTEFSSASYYVPTANGTWTMTTSGDYEIWNILAAGSYAVYRNELGNSSGTILACKDTGSFFGQGTSSEDRVHIKGAAGDAGYQHKYVIAHEFGHALLYQRENHSGATYSAGDGACPGIYPPDSTGHWFVSKEWQGAAFWEGFAQYYAAATFNNHTTETDCAYVTYKDYDFDQDGNNEPDQSVDCAGDPLVQDYPTESPASFTVTGTNYLDTYCDATFLLDCGSFHNCNRGTELDWLQFLWHLDTADSMEPEDFADIYSDAWVNGGGWAYTGNGHGSGYPGYELLQAAVRLHSGTWGAAWDTSDGTYGVDR